MIADDHVVVLSFDLLERLDSGVCEIDSRPLARQNIEDEFRNMDLVIDDQNLFSPQALAFRRSDRLHFLGLDVVANRQFQRECGSGAVRTPRVQFPAMVFHDLGANAQPQTRAAVLVLGRKERVENTGHIARVNTAAAVGHRYLKARAFAGRFDVNRAGPALHIRDRVFGIDDEIQNHLFDLIGIAVRVRQLIRQIGRDRDVVDVLLVLAQLNNIPDRIVQVERDTLRFGLCGETQEVLSDLPGTFGLRQDHIDHTPGGRLEFAA